MKKSVLLSAVAAAAMLLAGCAYDYGHPYGYGYAAADSGKVKTHS